MHPLQFALEKEFAAMQQSAYILKSLAHKAAYVFACCHKNVVMPLQQLCY